MNARNFSNLILRKYLKNFGGDIINVSGWEDSDKQYGYYREYFKNSSSYTISNIDGTNGTPVERNEKIRYLYLDLDKSLDKDLFEKFDVVFHHTVLEHVYSLFNALDIITSLSRDVIISVVPFMQPVHYTDSYSDYHRITPRFLEKYYREKGFSTILSDFNDQPFFHIYVINISTKHPESYREAFKDAPMNFDICIYPNKWGAIKKT